MSQYRLVFPKENDYPHLAEILAQPRLSANYHQLIEASASAYFETSGITRWLFLKRFRVALAYLEQISPSETLLDAGTGIGFFLPTLSLLAKTIVAVDIGKYPLQLAQIMAKKRHLTNIIFKRAELTNLNLPGKYFDSIVALSVLEHIPPQNLKTIMTTLSQLLKPGGYLIVGLPREGSPIFKFFQQLERRLLRGHIARALKDERRKNYATLGHVSTANQIVQAVKTQFKVIAATDLPNALVKLYTIMLVQKL